jgi:hypothetical protein
MLNPFLLQDNEAKATATKTDLTKEQVERYSRQLILAEIGVEGKTRLPHFQLAAHLRVFPFSRIERAFVSPNESAHVCCSTPPLGCGGCGRNEDLGSQSLAVIHQYS